MSRRLRRRRLLSMLGLAPLALVPPAAALTRPDKPKGNEAETLTVKIGVDTKATQELMETIRHEVDRQVIISLRDAKRRGLA